ncbi:putative metal chaperone [Lachnospiraceae bacterium KM106-2]|nr:putative metal chaperone [Lachnospiraceae bacterium KM106-2]
MTKIDIFSGFLGAGKTTLIKKLLEEAFKGEKLVLIENEFGEIGIDGGFLKDAGVEITEMNSGCICCSLVGDFGTALKDVLTKFHPDRIIIEPSGVGKLSDVIKAVEGIEKDADITINSTVTIADGTKCKMYMKNFGEFFNNQIENAKTIVLSRTQNMKQEKLEESVRLIKEHNPEATIITTPWEELDGKVVLSAMENAKSLAHELLEAEEVHHHDHDHECGCGHDHHDHDHDHDHDHKCGCGHDHHDHDHDHECGCGHDHHDHDHDHECGCGHDHHDHDHDHECGCGHDHHGHHHADDVFTSWGVETPHKYTKEEMQKALEKLADTNEFGTILRAKGIVPNVNGEWIYFDLVPGEYELRTGKPDYTGRLCVIGTNLEEEKIKELFHVK